MVTASHTILLFSFPKKKYRFLKSCVSSHYYAAYEVPIAKIFVGELSFANDYCHAEESSPLTFPLKPIHLNYSILLILTLLSDTTGSNHLDLILGL